MRERCMVSLRLNKFSPFHSFPRALEESATLAKKFKQKTPESITEDDLLAFNLRDEFHHLRKQSPLLYHVLAGSMGLGKDQLQVKGIEQFNFC